MRTRKQVGGGTGVAGTEKGTRVVTGALRKDAKRWDEQAELLLKLHHAVEELRLTRGEAGIYQGICGAYGDVVDFISHRAKEGHDRMTEIADALLKNAKAYDDNEAEVTETVDGTY
jgi:hypothetical protein